MQAEPSTKETSAIKPSTSQQSQQSTQTVNLDKCLICLKYFSTASSLKRHTKQRHEIHKKYQCSNCEISYTRHCDFVKHVKKAHPGWDNAVPKMVSSDSQTVKHKYPPKKSITPARTTDKSDAEHPEMTDLQCTPA